MDKVTRAELVQLFKILASEKRLAILDKLSNRAYTVNELGEELQIEQSVLSHQLRRLRDEQVVQIEKTGRQVHYMLKDEHLSDLLDSAMDHGKHVTRQPI
ncbi:winged helix-turn-helix transcriptional regulator [Fructobacillus sp. M2-14]|uniref:Winged helix-turn-helix transcriptional regulator n=1 Tax=Fructobacillus broussonetiae TaxID=2713173 RepID=A0ABS5QZL3_9LACO|nr:metalloregulator ArsR/SmtB family transcription factor [Fructobacillus broussonetiae]MBS9338616.1 winged helix-turn-helix transcriptional regulator [Fructobacillus broussonetiae]